MDPQEIHEIQSLLSSAQNILVLVPKNPTVDSLAAGLAVYLTLQKAGKPTGIACPQDLTVEFSHLVGIDKIASHLGNKNLIISFPYVEGSIEKVSYDVADGKFNLVIQPQNGTKILSPQDIGFSYRGTNCDLVFVVGAPRLANLERFYSEDPDFYSGIPLVNIDSHPENERFGKVNLVNQKFSSVSEAVALLLRDLNFPPDGDTATNLLAGISAATDNFSPQKSTVTSFEAAAFCLQVGGKREFPQKPPKISEPDFPKQPVKTLSEEKIPHDWLKPKIYKGSTLV